jgi:hypothetical protein
LDGKEILFLKSIFLKILKALLMVFQFPKLLLRQSGHVLILSPLYVTVLVFALKNKVVPFMHSALKLCHVGLDVSFLYSYF